MLFKFGGKRREENPQPFEGSESGGMNRAMRDHFVAMSGELVGTTLFLWFSFAATQIANTITPSSPPSLAALFYISTSFGFSLAVNAWCFYRVSGGLFNPAVCDFRPRMPSNRSTANALTAGHIGIVPRWRPSVGTGGPPFPPTNVRWHDCGRTGQMHVPGTTDGGHDTELWYIDRTGCFYRDVLHSAARLHRPHACGREVESHVHRSGRHWLGAICC